MTRSAQTEKYWPTETPEQMVERVRREQGDAEAALVAKMLSLPPAPRRKQVPKSVGNKERVPDAPRIPVTASQDNVLDPKHFASRWFRAPLPRSGAGAVPKVAPRVGAQRRRRGLNDS